MAKIMLALVRERTWPQKRLADHVGVTSRTVRQHLRAMLEAGVPLEREEEHPHVYWSVPRDWFPGGRIMTADQLDALARLLARQPSSPASEKLLRALLRRTQATVSPSGQKLAVSDELLTVFENGCANQTPVHMRYFSVSRGDSSTRHTSVHRIEYAPSPRIVATCHRDQSLKWFRLDRASQPSLDASEPYHPADKAAVAKFVRHSFDGFRSQREATTVVFTVRWPDGRWFIRDLGDEATLSHRAESVHVEFETAAVGALARRLVGLGDLVEAKTPELRERIVELAERALSTNGGRSR